MSSQYAPLATEMVEALQRSWEEALGPPLAPANRRLRDTAARAAKQLRNSLWFTPDAQAVVFAGMDDKELAV